MLLERMFEILFVGFWVSVVVVGALAWLRILPDGAIGSNIGGGMLLLNTGGG